MGAYHERTTKEAAISGSLNAAEDISPTVISCDRGGVSHGGKRHGSHHSRYSREAGQELVEFTLAFFLLVLFLFGAADLARIFHALVVITNAAREGARYGVTHYGMNDPGSQSYTQAGYIQSITDQVIAEAQGSGIDLSASTIGVTCTWVMGDASQYVCKRDDPIRVTVNYQLDLFMNFILPSPISLTRFVEMMIP